MSQTQLHTYVIVIFTCVFTLTTSFRHTLIHSTKLASSFSRIAYLPKIKHSDISTTFYQSYDFSLKSSIKDTSLKDSVNSLDITTSNSIAKPSYDAQYELTSQQFIYVVLSSIFVTCLIVADVIGVKLFDIPLPFEIAGHKSIEHTCGT